MKARRKQDREKGYKGRKRGLIIRMGLHWGVPYKTVVDEVAERKDFYGRFVNVSSRFQSEAEGDEIAVSDALLVELNRVQMESRSRGCQLLTPDTEEGEKEESLTDETRRKILEREFSIANFEVRSKGLRRMKGVSEMQQVTIVSLSR